MHSLFSRVALDERPLRKCMGHRERSYRQRLHN